MRNDRGGLAVARHDGQMQHTKNPPPNLCYNTKKNNPSEPASTPTLSRAAGFARVGHVFGTSLPVKPYSSKDFSIMSDSVHLPSSSSLGFVEEIYSRYLDDPTSVEPEWRQYFQSMSNGDAPDTSSQIGPKFRPASLFNPTAPGAPAPVHKNNLDYDADESSRIARAAVLQDRVDQFIRSYRARGHMVAQLDPLGRPQEFPEQLTPEYFGLSEADLDRKFSSETLAGEDRLTLREIIERLRNTYCRYIGVQFMHIDDVAVRSWLQKKMESTQNRLRMRRKEQIRILTRLTDAVIFEEFIRRKFIGAKSFSLEGAESLIPLLDLAIEKSAEQGVNRIVVGMAHRGRLNVLANIIGKSPRAIFREFEDTDPDRHMGRGDVKYHLGYNKIWESAEGRKVRLSLAFNPSHLEFVNPVATGRMRAKQDRRGDNTRTKGMVLLIHGDAAFAGQGVIQETLNLSQLPGYTVGGTLHVVINNQIGFTTSPSEARSCPYATDIAKMLQVPIFHVNGEDPESVAQVVQLALDFRAKFQQDVVIDMYCYRRLGHNETDEPAFTQPLMYAAIAKRPSVREAYLEHLLKMTGVTREEADEIAESRRAQLEEELTAARNKKYTLPTDTMGGIWTGYEGGPEANVPDVETAVPVERLKELLLKQAELPEDFTPHPRIQRHIKARVAMAEGTQPLDWSAAEALAFASIATQGHRVRLTGQDVQRGTFSHRHAVFNDMVDGRKYYPLKNLSEDQAPVEIFNSPLSEIGVLGFEYGYSLDCPDGLILWEAQYGDFWNVAQVIVDQFIASGEDKWHRLSGLVMLLPHGMEGSGPEHSSARLERFMALAAEDNLQIVNPTLPSQYFHLLRRQVLRPWRKPLIVMSPKSLLRHLEVVSSLEELATGTFRRVIPDTSPAPAKDIKRILLCSGKLYYELDKHRELTKRHDVAIVRIEQLYPVPIAELEPALAKYRKGTPAFWVQEEPMNMGAWRNMRIYFSQQIFGRLPFAGISRPPSASPATGSGSSHKKEQEHLIAMAFGEEE